MALTQPELDRVRYETGANLLRIGSEPYVTFQAIFSRVILPYLTDIGSTSTTTVVASAAGASTTITVAANPVAQDTALPAFAVGAPVVVDVGPAQEFSTIAVVSGLTLTMTLSNAHGAAGAPYPVSLKGSEWIVRDILSRIDAINTQMATVAPQSAGVEQVDEIKINVVRGRGQRSMIDDLIFQRQIARDDLCSALGLPNYWRAKGSSGGSRVELY